MKLHIKPFTVLIFISFVIISASFINPGKSSTTAKRAAKSTAKIQVAILLDVSNSMDGLIDQAKAQLWNMVSVMGKAKCNEVAPQIEIALYEYGRSTNDIKEGYVKQINPFTNNLDQLSQNLFNLKTNGGDEYCGHVIYTSLSQLKWDNASANNYRVIFIAGNEDFLQGDVLYTKACNEAKAKGVIVNTIYCGDKMQGIAEHWNLGAECGGGSFTNIDQNAKEREIPTPYDSIIYTLNEKLNATYMSYGREGERGYAAQASADKMNKTLSAGTGLKRIAAKSKSNVYNNESWDLVDASKADSMFFTKVEMKTLPVNLQNKTRKELQQLIKDNSNQRSLIQKQIETTNNKRDAYIAAERSKAALKNNSATLETEIEKIIRQQVKQYHMVID